MTTPRITRDPNVMGGKPCIRGLRVTVDTLLGLLAAGQSHERILQAYPYLEAEDIDAALADAGRRDIEGYAKMPVTDEEFAVDPDDLKSLDTAS